MGGDGVIGGRGHGCPHVVGVGDALVHNLAYRHMGDIGAGALPCQNSSSGGGSGPLGGGSSLAAVLQRGAVLALGSAEVGGDYHSGPLPEAAIQGHRGQSQPLPHGGAGPIEAEKGNLLAACGEGRTDTLIQQVAGKEPVYIRGRLARLI